MILHWPWRRPRRSTDSAEALASSEQEVEDARGRWREVLERTEAMAELGHRNGFADSIRLAYELSEEDRRGGRK